MEQRVVESVWAVGEQIEALARQCDTLAVDMRVENFAHAALCVQRMEAELRRTRQALSDALLEHYMQRERAAEGKSVTKPDEHHPAG